MRAHKAIDASLEALRNDPVGGKPLAPTKGDRMSYALRMTGSCLCLVASVACAHSMIAGTQVPDTSENREIFEVLIKYKTALEARDAQGIIALVSTKYFEDNGTPDQSDDYGYEQLANKILPEALAATKEMYADFQVNEVAVEGNKARADIRYDSRARLDLPSGTLWDSHREFNRVEFERENGKWMVVSGL